MRADYIRAAGPACARHVLRGAAGHLPVSRHRQAALYASSTWIGFTKATDRQRVDGFLRRIIRSGYCSPDTPTFAEQCANNYYLTTFVITRITYCTVSFLHLQQPHKTTIFDSELTANNYRNILDI